ncbi:hypothetical protein HDU76_006561 [Blyttiomyces sp. JEL0837]|nr:hypothetical protein HDU76_006561 [Blyttiomyces sp. JEL0837]
MGILAQHSLYDDDGCSSSSDSVDARFQHGSAPGTSGRISRLARATRGLTPNELRLFLLDVFTNMSLSAKEATTEIMWSTLSVREQLMFEPPSGMISGRRRASRGIGGMGMGAGGPVMGTWADSATPRPDVEDLLRRLASPAYTRDYAVRGGSPHSRGTATTAVMTSLAERSQAALNGATPTAPTSTSTNTTSTTASDNRHPLFGRPPAGTVQPRAVSSVSGGVGMSGITGANSIIQRAQSLAAAQQDGRLSNGLNLVSTSARYDEMRSFAAQVGSAVTNDRNTTRVTGDRPSAMDTDNASIEDQIFDVLIEAIQRAERAATDTSPGPRSMSPDDI